jgi:hypothetical protein
MNAHGSWEWLLAWLGRSSLVLPLDGETPNPAGITVRFSAPQGKGFCVEVAAGGVVLASISEAPEILPALERALELALLHGSAEGEALRGPLRYLLEAVQRSRK